MRAINSLILHILIFEFFQFIRTDQIEEPSFVASNQFDEPLVTKIKCHNRSSSDQEFTAFIRRPTFYTTSPIIDNDLESKFSLFSNFKHSSFHCRFEFDPQTNLFAMKLTSFDKCGVSEMRSNDNKPYLSVSIRFAQLAGLRTKNDLNLVLICREQNRVYMRNHELDFRPGDHVIGSNTRIFANEPQQFHVKLQLLKLQLYPTDHNQLDDESNQVNKMDSKDEDQSTIEVGEMVKLNAVVRSGDGWNYAFLKEVIISRRAGKKKTTSRPATREITTKDPIDDDDLKQNVYHFSNYNKDETEPIYGESNLNELTSSKEDQVILVDKNGCRNPTFQLLAPSHPYQLANNGLDVNFEFRAFIFENMDIKQDRLRISAKIVACQQLDDCKPVNCEENKRRKRRWAEGHQINEERSENSLRNLSANKVSWSREQNSGGKRISQQERQLEFRIKSSKSRLNNALESDYVHQRIQPENQSRSIHFSYALMAIGLMSIILLSILAGSCLKYGL